MQKRILIKIENLNKFYGTKHVLKNINLDIREDDRIGIIGPNGNGKSTLCEIIASLRPFDSGNILVAKNLTFGMQMQENPFPRKITTWNFCEFYLKSYGLVIPRAWFKEAFDLLSIAELVDTPVINLSGGQKQRVNILLSTIHRPDVLILDELAAGLDLESQTLIYKYITQRIKDTKAVVLVSHNLEEIEKLCNKLLMIIDGEIKLWSDIDVVVKKYGNLNKYVSDQFKDYYQKRMNYLKPTTKLEQDTQPITKWEQKLQLSNNKNHLSLKKHRNVKK